MNDISSLEKLLRVSFRNRALLEQALTHRSFINENPDLETGSNERLEFLGDAVIGMVVAQELYKRFPQRPEGELTALRVALVRGETLASVAVSLGLGDYLRLGVGEEGSGGRTRSSNLAAVFEALAGAVLLDSGLGRARAFVLKSLRPQLRCLIRQGVTKDPKSALQEAVQALGRPSPTYRTIDAQGPDHERRFTVEAVVGGEVLSTGSGRRKADAQRAAAEQALERLKEPDK